MSEYSFKKTALKALMGTAILSLSAFMPMSAKAQELNPDIYFFPAKAWTVSKSANTCRITNQFNNGYIVEIAGSQSWVDVLNINFRQAIFEQGKDYDVKLTVPGKEAIALKGHAPNPAGLSTNLKRHKELYKDITTSSVFDIEIEGNAFRFYLTGFASNVKDFERCMGGLESEEGKIKQAQTDQEPELVAVSRTSNQLDEDLIETNEAMLMEQDIMDVTVTDAQGEEIYSDETLPAEEEDIIVEIHEEVSEDDVAELASMTPMPEDEEIIEEKFIPASEVKEPIISPEEQHAEIKPPSPPAEVIQAEEVSKKQIIKSIKTPDTIVHKKSSKAKADFRSERVNTEDYGASSILLSTIQDLKAKVEALETENKALNSDLQMSLQASQKEGVAIATDNWNLERATLKYNEAERQLKSLSIKLQAERAKCAAEKKDLEMTLFDPQITEASQLAHLAELQAELAEAKAEIARLRSGL